ncbi:MULTISPECIES: serine O-acetyltransferase [Methylomonas]|uniref:serine O-acetyltransferase n=1 Tax=Methylomonas TaxID=416 RepID=UPI001231FBA7|nr:serine O-acetyltransferase [Methylomonas rhizoryzae]
MMFFSPPRNRKVTLWQDWREDVACVFARDPAARNIVEVLLAYPGVHAVLLYRMTNRLWHADWKLAARLLAAFARWLTNVDIHPGATIGKRFFIDHGACVVIGETAEIGNDVTLYHGVTLGGTTWNKEKRHPTLGDNVLVGAGAKILGAITLGNNVRVGANSVVIKDVPPCCTVIGIPGRIIQQKGVKIKDPRGIDLDHHLVPDPVGKALTCLVERLDKLEADQEKLFQISGENCGGCDAETVCHGEETVALEQIAGRR